MEQYWNNAVTFEQYLKDAKEKIENPKNQDDIDKKYYYELAEQRTNRMLKVFKINEEQLATLKEKNFKGKILVITEAWCGDSSQTLPVIAKFFEGHNEVRIFYRDSDPSLINQFLTNGVQAIPKVLILDENFEVKNTWGPRPKYGFELLQKHKANPEEYTKEQFYNDLQVYYAKNRGKDTISELLELL